jgi:hypothetical protein
MSPRDVVRALWLAAQAEELLKRKSAKGDA